MSNPPYVPTPPVDDSESISSAAGPSWALRDGGSVLLVQSAFADVQRSLDSLRSAGLDAKVIAYQWIPIGPVLSARADWMEQTGRLRRGCREEELVVIRADKP